MPKEFDIYLNNRLTQCDIIVYSIPFRDGLTAANRIVLESCLESYMLQKFVASQTNSELIPHIDKMIKVCIERLQWDSAIDASIQFQTHYILSPIPHLTEISSGDNLETLRNMFTAADETVQITIASVNAMIAKSLGNGQSAYVSDAEVKNVLKRSLLKANNEICFTSNINEIHVQKNLGVNTAIIPSVEVANLCYRFYSATETIVQFAASVLGTEIHFSFGNASSSVVVDSIVSKTNVKKYETVHNSLLLTAQAVEGIIQYLQTETSKMHIAFEAEEILKRHRLLSETDANTLASYDDMTLNEMDYIIL